MRIVLESKTHTSEDCLCDDCLLIIDDVPYVVTRCVMCGKIHKIVYSNIESGKFIDKHKDLKMFVL